MTDIDNKPAQMLPGGHLNVQTENIAFDPEKLIACGKCGRMNPPNRLNCLYCAHELDIGTEILSVSELTLKRPEDWESGFNVVLVSEIDPDGPEVATISKLTRIGVDQVRKIAASKRPIPLVRTGSEKESQIICEALAGGGISSLIVSDESLMPDRPPIRLRAAEFRDGTLTLVEFNTGKCTEVAGDNLALIVPGVISETKTDQLEKKGRRGNSKVLEETEAASDEAILDVYDRRHPLGYRVMTSGFDFSCLGDDKGLLAAENIRLLAGRLKQFAPHAKFVSEYVSVKNALSDVWEIDRRKHAKGMQRSGFAKRDFGSTVSTSNLRQMNKFSRLQWHLL